MNRVYVISIMRGKRMIAQAVKPNPAPGTFNGHRDLVATDKFELAEKFRSIDEAKSYAAVHIPHDDYNIRLVIVPEGPHAVA